MKKFARSAGGILCTMTAGALCALPLGGCATFTQQTPTQQVYNAETALDAVIAGINAAHDAGVISAADEQKLAPYVNAAAAALASLQSAVTANNSVSISQGLAAFDAAMQQLVAVKSQVPALATTRP